MCPTLRQDPRRCSLPAPGPAARPGGSGVNSGAAQPCALPLGSRGVHQPEEVTARGRLEEGLSAGSTADAHGRTGGEKAEGRTLLSSVGKNHQVNSFAAKNPDSTHGTTRRAGAQGCARHGAYKNCKCKKKACSFSGKHFPLTGSLHLPQSQLSFRHAGKGGGGQVKAKMEAFPFSVTTLPKGGSFLI